MKITCNIIKDLLPLYIDDVLSDDSKKAVEEHIKKCAVCTAYLHELTHNSIDDIPSKHIEDIMPLKNVKKNTSQKKDTNRSIFFCHRIFDCRSFMVRYFH